jgi:hypothetical protein
MKRDVMLPKFNLPGQTTWLMKGLWIAGAVVLVQVGVVGTLLLRDKIGDGDRAPAVAPVEPAPVAAKAPPTDPGSAPQPPVEASAEPATPPSARPAGARQAFPGGPRMNRGFGPGKPGMARLRGKGRKGGDRVFARTSFGARKATGPRGARKGVVRTGAGAGGTRPAAAKGKPDAIDQLLRNFK